MSANDIEAFKSQAQMIFTIAYDLGHQTIRYDQFVNSMKHINGVSIDKLVKAAKYHCGPDYMQSIGFKFNDDSNLIIQPFHGHEDSVVHEEEEEYNNVDHAFVDVQTPPKEVYIFDGDESKLYPGMRVKISTGAIYSLPSVPTYATQTNQTRKFQRNVGRSYRKMVKKLIESHDKYNQIIAKMNSTT
uniref:Uncharacterized protein n=1 Tax=Panagrolaimus sp. PS1159 TaxID=55785 RepID=A0AC35FNQ0_9BILA